MYQDLKCKLEIQSFLLCWKPFCFCGAPRNACASKQHVHGGKGNLFTGKKINMFERKCHIPNLLFCKEHFKTKFGSIQPVEIYLVFFYIVGRFTPF